MRTECKIRSTSTHTAVTCDQSTGIYVLILSNVNKFGEFSAILDKEKSKLFQGGGEACPWIPLENACAEATHAFGACFARMVKMSWLLISKCWQVWYLHLRFKNGHSPNSFCELKDYLVMKTCDLWQKQLNSSESKRKSHFCLGNDSYAPFGCLYFCSIKRQNKVYVQLNFVYENLWLLTIWKVGKK